MMDDGHAITEKILINFKTWRDNNTPQTQEKPRLRTTLYEKKETDTTDSKNHGYPSALFLERTLISNFAVFSRTGRHRCRHRQSHHCHQGQLRHCQCR